jgi:hypothetical protein
MRDSASKTASFKHARSITESERLAILDDPCHYCGSIYSDVVDHVDPVVQGGGVEDGNLVAACDRCNSEKSGRTPDQWRAWRIRRGYPWPPPNTDTLIFGAVATMTAAEHRELNVALTARDATARASLIAIRDRAWVGQDISAEADAAEIRHALAGAPTRIAAARHRALGKLASDFTEASEAHTAYVDDVCADPMRYRSESIRFSLDAVKRQLAEAAADFADRFMNWDEMDTVRDLLDETDNWEAWRQRVVETREWALDGQHLPLAVECIRQVFCTRLANALGKFSARCSDQENETLQSLLTSWMAELPRRVG